MKDEYIDIRCPHCKSLIVKVSNITKGILKMKCRKCKKEFSESL